MSRVEMENFYWNQLENYILQWHAVIEEKQSDLNPQPG